MSTIEIDVRPNSPFPQVLYECWCEQGVTAGRWSLDEMPSWDRLHNQDQQFWRSLSYRIIGRYMGRPSRLVPKFVNKISQSS